MTKEGRILKALSGFYYVQCEDELVEHVGILEMIILHH